jgi:hypothetical protein
VGHVRRAEVRAAPGFGGCPMMEYPAAWDSAASARDRKIPLVQTPGRSVRSTRIPLQDLFPRPPVVGVSREVNIMRSPEGGRASRPEVDQAHTEPNLGGWQARCAEIIRVGTRAVKSLGVLINICRPDEKESLSPARREGRVIRKSLELDLGELKYLLGLDDSEVPATRGGEGGSSGRSFQVAQELTDGCPPDISSSKWHNLLKLRILIDDLSDRLKGVAKDGYRTSVSMMRQDFDDYLLLMGGPLYDELEPDSTPRQVLGGKAPSSPELRPQDDPAMIGLTQAAEFYDLSKSSLSKAAKAPNGEYGHLRCKRVGRRVYFWKEDIIKWSKRLKALRR